jgi:hypothetical protein
MVYLPPYRHELRGMVKPFVDVLTARHDRLVHKRFQSVMDEIEDLLANVEVPRENAKDVYLSTIKRCRDNPAEVADREVAEAVAAVTTATRTDVLGILYQHTGRTAEEHFNQYFTPPNAAAALAAVGETTRTHFEPPSPSRDNVSGETTLSMFKGGDGDEEESSVAPDGGTVTTVESTVFFDPACGSGRLLLAAARRSSEAPVVLGWDLERDAARMAALTLALNEIPGWVVGGDAIQMTPREVYRITPAAATPLQCFRSYSPEDAPDIISSRPADPREYDPLTALESHRESVEQTITEINRTLERGIDQTVANPPFSSRDLEDEAPVTNRSHTDYDTAKDPIGRNTKSLRSSQAFEWLFTELGLEYTRPDGAVSFIVPTSMLANPSESAEREWLLNIAYYEAGLELPPETFAPETTTGTSLVSLVPKKSENVGLEINHQIFMAIVETIGHDSQATRKQLTQEGEPAEASTEDLPKFYQTHVWRGIDMIGVPDDDLLPAVREHREMRTEEEASP